MASAAMLGRTVAPVMLERGYDKRMTLGAAMGGACLAPIIPPSILAILIGTIAQVSIGALFQAGIIPGFLIAVLSAMYVAVRLFFSRSLAPREQAGDPASAGTILRALASLLPFFAVIGFVMGSIIAGYATPSESAAIGVIGALVVAALLGRFSLGLVLDSLRATAKVTAMIMAILIASQLFSQLVALSGTGSVLNQFVASLTFPSWVMLIILLFIPFVLCMFLDEIAIMLILIPLYSPLLPSLGFDPIWFWTLFLINMTIGAIAPPVGYVLFILQGVVKGVTLSELFAASIPYVIIFIVASVIIGIFPETVLYLTRP